MINNCFLFLNLAYNHEPKKVVSDNLLPYELLPFLHPSAAALCWLCLLQSSCYHPHLLFLLTHPQLKESEIIFLSDISNLNPLLSISEMPKLSNSE